MKTIINIITSGAVINFLLVILGAVLGTVFKKGMPERIKNALLFGMALCVFYIGVDGMLNTGNKILVIIISMAVGAVIGELADIDKRVKILGEKIENRFSKSGQKSNIAEGFVTATMLFCVGAMTIVGSINSGISGDNATLYSKSVIDCISAAALASGLGFGVAVAAFPVLIIEGVLTLLASAVEPILTQEIITQMSTIGSILIVGLSLNMLGITKLKVMNFVPAIFLPLLLCIFM